MSKIKVPNDYKLLTENFTDDGSIIVEILKEKTDNCHITSNNVRVTVNDLDKEFNVSIEFSIDNECITKGYSSNNLIMLLSEIENYSKVDYQCEIALDILKQIRDMTRDKAQQNQSVDEQKLSIVDKSEKLQQGNKIFNEDAFLLDYIEWQKGNMHISDYAKKYDMTVWELQDKLREYRLSISNIGR